jgi:hypothetical protein
MTQEKHAERNVAVFRRVFDNPGEVLETEPDRFESSADRGRAAEP